jgi:hypothetical protein
MTARHHPARCQLQGHGIPPSGGAAYRIDRLFRPLPLRNMHHFYPRGAFYLACMAAGVVLMMLFYLRSEQFWALWVWLWT